MKIVGVWALILIAAFLVLEGCFRFFRHERDPLKDIVQKDPEYLLKPNTTFHSLSSVAGEFEYDAHINRFGYRGGDFLMPKPAGTVRILAVGDSFTFGVGSPDWETIPAFLEKELLSKGVAAEVINAGIGGTSPVYHYVNLRDIHLRYQPDAVVLFLDLTDLWDDWNGERHAVLGADGEIRRFDPMFTDGKRDWWITATYYSVFCRYFHNKVIRSFRKMMVLGLDRYCEAALKGKRAKAVIATDNHARARQASIEYDGVLFMRGRVREELIREHWPRTAKYLTLIRDMLRARGIPLMIVMYPHGIYVDGEQWAHGRVTWGFEPGKRYDDHFPFELAGEYAGAEGIPFFNATPAFLKAPSGKYFFDWDGHMTAQGNRITARALAEDEGFMGLIRSAVKSGHGK